MHTWLVRKEATVSKRLADSGAERPFTVVKWRTLLAEMSHLLWEKRGGDKGLHCKLQSTRPRMRASRHVHTETSANGFILRMDTFLKGRIMLKRDASLVK
jgi:hypothetical protein